MSTSMLRSPNYVVSRRLSPQHGLTLPLLPEMSLVIEWKSSDLHDTAGCSRHRHCRQRSHRG